MGLNNATASFQRMMQTVFADKWLSTLMLYVDDLLIYTTGSFDAHLQELREVLDIIRAEGLTCKLPKCELAQPKVEFLGHLVGGGQRQPVERLIGKIAQAPRPRNKKEVQAFIGLVGYYRHYVANFAKIANPLTDVMGTKAKWVWEIQ